MGGNMKVWIVVATWFWWNAVVGPTWSCPVEQHTLSGSCPVEQHTLSWSCPLMVAEQHTLKFTTKGATKSSYTQFIEALRAQLASGEKPSGIPVTREPSTVPDSQRFVLVELSNGAAHSITLAVDVTNAYVVAYMNESKSFFFKEGHHDPAIDNLFPKIERYTFQFKGSYPGLQKFAEDRKNISLGMNRLENAISVLRFSKLNQERALARSLIVVIQMVAEAARFTYIESQVRKRIPRVEEVFFPTPTMLKYENNWKALSRAIQQSNQGGVFLNPVQLIDTNNKDMKVDNTKHPAVKGLAIMLFICKSKSDRAAYPEPTVLISGRNGLCVEVRDYHNRNSIELRPCKETLEVNQLWTLSKDGTIRSNGKCLTTNGSSPGSQVRIYDCPTRVTAATTIWQLWENGTVMNPQSGLVLSAESGNSGTTLSVETNIYASRQGWLASNNTKPFVTSIIGFNDLCMQAYRDAMWVEECASGNANQKWALYPDGSIRPQQNQDHCLTISSDKNSQEIIIIISSCSHASEDQRWVFKKEGSIWNLASGMVMEVKRSDPSLHQIILSGFTGNPNQKWLPLF